MRIDVLKKKIPYELEIDGDKATLYFAPISGSNRATIASIVEKGEKTTSSDILPFLDLCQDHLIGWDGLDDGEGNPWLFSKKNRDELIDMLPLGRLLKMMTYLLEKSDLGREDKKK